MLWFESLLFYGCEEREQEREDVDIALLPTIVEKVILPKLTGRCSGRLPGGPRSGQARPQPLRETPVPLALRPSWGAWGWDSTGSRDKCERPVKPA